MKSSVLHIILVPVIVLHFASPSHQDCGAPGSLSVPENTPIGTIVLNFTSPVQIDDNEYLQLDKDNKSLIVTSSIDYEDFTEKNSGESFELKVSCQGQTTRFNTLIVIQNIFDNGFYFPKSSYSHNISEHNGLGDTVIVIEIQTNDRGQSIASDVEQCQLLNFNKSFRVETYILDRRGRCTIKSNKVFDAETDPAIMTLNLAIGGSGFFNNTEVIINLLDVDDSGVKFSKSYYAVKVEENKSPMECFISVYAEDEDISKKEILYKMRDTASSKFMINSTTGCVTLTEDLDREKQDHYILQIEAYKKEKPYVMDICLLEVTVEDENDNFPEMLSNYFNTSVVENTAVGSWLLTVQGKDEDENDTLTYHISNSSQCCTIDKNKGILKVHNSSCFDRELNETLRLQVWVTDQVDHKSNVSTIDISILDENDNSPEFENNFYNFTISKALNIGDSVGNVTAFDKDKGENGRIIFELSRSAGPFSIDQTGHIQVKLNLSFPYTEFHEFSVFAIDNATKPFERMSSALVMVHVEDRNLYAPQLPVRIFNVTIAEGEADLEVLFINATDPDPEDVLRFLPETNDYCYFLNNSGRVKVSKPFDYETSTNFSLKFIVTDGLHNTSGLVNFFITDVNDNVPKFVSGNYEAKLDENVFKDNLISIQAQDDDFSSANNMITYRLITEEWSQHISVHLANGSLSVIEPFDREKLSSGWVHVLVEAVDNGNPQLNNFTSINITVNDVNDNVPQIVNFLPELNISEIKTTGWVFYSFEAVDADIEDNNREGIFYISDDKMFNISPKGHLQNNIPVLRNTKEDALKKLTVCVRNKKNYSDSQLHDDCKNITIKIEDINDHHPKFENSSYNIKVPNYHEPGPLDNLVMNYTDADIDLINQESTIIMKNHSEFFTIDQNQVVLLREPNPGTYVLQVEVHNIQKYNNAQDTVDTAQIEIEVQQAYPYFDQDINVCNVSENYKGDLNCSAARATNPFGSEMLVYSIQQTLLEDVFRINTSTGIVTLNNAIDYENETTSNVYFLEVTAALGNNSKVNVTKFLTINVLDVPDTPPTLHSTYFFILPENKTGCFGNLSVIDHGNDIYSVNFTTNDSRIIVNSSLDVCLKKPIDYEESALTTVNVVASNNGNAYSHSTIYISVININDNDPELVGNTTWIIFEEEKGYQFPVEVYDRDGDNVTCHVQNCQLQLKINRCVFSLIDIVDRENLTDNPIKCAFNIADGLHLVTEILTVHVLDINDHAPVFDHVPTECHTLENSTHLDDCFLNATDEDEEKNQQLQFILPAQTWSEYFEIENNGIIKMTKEFDVDALREQFINLTIIVKDCGLPQLTNETTVSIFIKDVNDNAPEVIDAEFDYILDECSEGAAFHTVEAIDKDLEAFNRILNYTIFVNPKQLFSISDKGILLHKKLQNDSEDLGGQNLTVVIHVFNPDRPNNFAYQHISVYIKDKNNHYPELLVVPDTILSIPNYHALGMLDNLSLSYTDEDADEINKLSNFQLKNSTDIFAVNQDKIVLLRMPEPGNYTLDIEVSNIQKHTCQNKTVFSNQGYITIEVNQAYPVFIQANFSTCMVNENYQGVLNCSAAKAKDPLETESIIYSIRQQSKEDKFSINTLSGILNLTEAIDFEDDTTSNVYILEVTAALSILSEVNITKFLTINVLNIPDTPPTLDSTYIFFWPENKTGCMGNLTIIQHGHDTYDIHYTTNDSRITVNSSLVVCLEMPLDYEESVITTMSVSAWNDGFMYSQTFIYISVINVNDNDPEVVGNMTWIIFEEEKGLQFPVQVYDKDGDNVTCHIQDCQLNFKINSRCVFTLKEVVDRENLKNNPVICLFNITDGLHMVTENITIHVLDINDHAPVFDYVPFECQTLENSTYLNDCYLNATDEDDEKNQQFEFYLPTQTWSEYFEIRKNGIIKMKKAFDVDATKEEFINLTVEVRDCGLPQLTNETTVTIFIKDVNDNAPEVIATEFEYILDECSKKAAFHMVKAIDKDLDAVNRILTYEVFVNPRQLFSISDKGILLHKKLQNDSEDLGGQNLTVVIHVFNPDRPNNFAYQHISVYIKDVNNHYPELLVVPDTILSIPNYHALGMLDNLSLSYMDVDADEINKLSNFQLKNSADIFAVNQDKIVLLRKPEPGNYTLDIEVSNIQKNTCLNKTVFSNHGHINIEVYQAYPVFIQANVSTCNVSENYQGVLNCSAAKAKDPLQTESIIYTIGQQSKEDKFSINTLSGILNLTEAIDFEDDTTSNVYILEVTAALSIHSEVNVTKFLTINVLNIPDTPPTLDSTYIFFWPENKTGCMGNLTIIHHGHDIYDIHFTTNDSRITVNSSLVVCLEMPLDYEESVITTMNVSAWNDGFMYSQTFIYISVINVNDNDPEVVGNMTWTIFEEEKGLQFPVQVYDKDGDNVTCHIQDCQLHFKINSRCVFTLKKVVDRENLKNNPVICLFNITDGLHMVTEKITIHVLDINDHAPVFDYVPFECQTLENSTHLNDCYLNATDEDDEKNQQFEFYLPTQTWSEYFEIEKTGIIKMKKAFDVDTTKEEFINLTVEVRDCGLPQLTNETTVTIFIKDVNDNAPEVIATEFEYILDECSKKAAFHVVKAIDKDLEAVNRILTYEVFVNPRQLFSISDKGILLHKKLQNNSEDLGGQNLTVVIHVFNPDRPNNFAYQHISVYIKDVNNHYPELLVVPDTILSIPNYHALGMLDNLSLSYIDEDADEINKLSNFQLKNSADIFAVNQDKIILLRMPEPGNYTLDIEVSNIQKYTCQNKLVFSNHGHLTIEVYQAYPVFIQANFSTCNVSENYQGVLNCSAAKAKEPLQTESIIYTIRQQSKEDKFSINALSGILNLTEAIDFEDDTTSNVYILEVTAALSIHSEVNVTKFLTINVLNIPDTPPTLDSTYIFFWPENKTGCMGNLSVIHHGHDIYDIHFITNESWITVNSSLGVCLEMPLDYEKSVLTTVNVSVCNNGFVYSQTIIYISVINVNDNNPEVVGNMTWTIFEEEKGLQFPVQVYDKDGDDVTCTLPENCQFDLTIKNCVFELEKSVDRENLMKNPFTCSFNITDGVHNITEKFTIHVLDVNDHAPVFDYVPTECHTLENSTHLNDCYLNATDGDADENGRIQFHFPAQTWSEYFHVTEHGIINMTKEFDVDTTRQQYINLTVEIRDSGTPRLTNETTVIIFIEDINDNAPEVVDAEFEYSLYEDSEAADFHTVEVTDLDLLQENRIIIFELKENPWGLFNISDIGVLHHYNMSVPNEELGDQNGTVIIYVYNPDRPSFGAYQNITIFVKAINKYPPVFSQALYQFNISENTGLKKSINGTRISAKDNDNTKEYNSVTYWLDEPAIPFQIDAHTGILYVISTLDATKTYNFSVHASDNFLMTTANISIYVQDENSSPICPESLLCRIKENTNGTFNCSANAKDADFGNFAQLNYELDEPQKSLFKVQKSGDIVPTRALDYENDPHTFYLRVTATDGGGLNCSVDIQVNLLDVNDNPPTYTGQTNFSIPESDIVGLYVGTISGHDKDNIDRNCLSYSIEDDKGYFHINNLTGEIITNRTFDFDTEPNKYDLTIDIRDSEYTSYINISVEIKDVNENKPVFMESMYQVDVLENITTGHDIVQVIAHDEDKDDQIKFSISNAIGLCDNVFSINSTSGMLTYNGNLTCIDYEKRANYEFLITATDTGNPPKSSNATVFVNVQDVNDEVPIFVENGYNITLPENASINLSVLKVIAEDPDTPLTGLEFFTEDTEFFAFDSNSSRLLLRKALDAEAETKMNFTIVVSDGQSSSRSHVIVDILDINDNTPYFDSRVHSEYKLEQNTKPGKQIANITAHDADVSNNGFTYILEESFGLFEINWSTGLLQFKPSKNYSIHTNQTFVLNVLVFDHGAPPNKNSTDVTISVVSSNQHQPELDNKTYTFTVPEKSNITTCYKITAKDDDANIAGKLIYTIQPTYNGTFSIDRDNGTFCILKPLLYSMSSNKYTLNLTVRDSAEDFLSTQSTIDVFVEDINDPPIIQDVISYLCNTGNVTTNQLVGQVNAQDSDSPKFNNLTYKITQPSDKFIIFSNGSIYSKTDLDASVINGTEIYIQIEDSGNLTANGKLTLSQNKGKPQFTPKLGVVSISENVSLPYDVYDVNTTQENTGSILYSIRPGEFSDYFKIDSSTGQITETVPLDRETKQKINLKIGASNDNGICFTGVNIHLIDVNDNAPHFSQHIYEVNINESEKTGSCILNVSASDQDEAAILTFNFSMGNEYFQLQNVSTSVTCMVLKKQIDYERIDKEHQIIQQIVVSDGIYNDTCEVKVSVSDVNDNSPYFQQPVYILHISEDVHIGSTLHTFSAKDLDDLDEEKLHYFFCNETDEGRPCSIHSEDGLGYLLLKENLDRETINSYNFSICVNDTIGNQNSTAFRLIIDDVNDCYPNFTNTKRNFSINEGSTNFSFEVKAFDKDLGENGTVDFSIESGNIGEHFQIENISDNVARVIIKKKIDLEDESISKINSVGVITLDILAKDRGNPPLSTQLQVTIDVLDENDCSPEFTKTIENITIMEDMPVHSTLLHATATDEDISPANRNITYYLASDNGDNVILDYLEVQNKTGVVFLSKILRANSTEDQYHFVLQASDRVHVTNMSITLLVRDINDHDPQFINSTYRFSVPENDCCGLENMTQFVGQVQAYDQDFGANAKLNYTIVTETNSLFSVDSKGIIHTKGILDADNCQHNHYMFTVIAEDGGQSQRMGFSEVEVFITDRNDNSPQFTSSKYTAEVAENVPTHTTISTTPLLKASDIDAGINGTAGIIYQLLPLSTEFSINNITGELSVIGSLDREAEALYNFTIVATDQKGVGNNGTASLVVNITDIIDETPQFTNSSYEFSIQENANLSQVVGLISATDPDITGSLKFSIKSESNKFYIEENSGILHVGGNLDREEQAHYTLEISVTDSYNSNETKINITILDINDNSPVFKANHYDFYLQENNGKGQKVAQVSAEDLDEGINGTVHYDVMGADSAFNISQNGEINALIQFDRENQSIYTFQVIATDGGSPPLQGFTNITVHITDENDNKPLFYKDQDVIVNQTAIVLERSPIGTIVAVPFVRDADAGENAKVTFILEQSVFSDLFDIDQNTGLLTVKKAIDINRLISQGLMSQNDTKREFPLTITALDGGNIKLNNSLQVLVTLAKISDDVLSFEKDLYNISVMENTANGTELAIIKAITNGTNYQLSYMVADKKLADIPFDLKQCQGEECICTKGIIDREKQDHYHFTLQVTDGRTPEKTAYALVQVTVTDENDNHPQFTSLPKSLSQEENSAFLPFNVSAIDLDLGENGTVSYQISGVPFDIDELGLVTYNSTLDRETQDVYHINITACDLGALPLCTSAVIPFHITDVNDNPPNIDQSLLSGKTVVKINETVQKEPFNEHVIMKINASDPDNGLNSTIMYEIIEPKSEKFFISPLDGTLIQQGPLDYETQTNYSLHVLVTDLGVPVALNSTVTILVDVLDLPDDVPVFNQSFYQFPATKYSLDVIGHIIGQVKATGNGGVVYGIASEKVSVSINSKTGELNITKSIPNIDMLLINVSAENAIYGHLKSFSLVEISTVSYAADLSETSISLNVTENLNYTKLVNLNQYATENGTHFIILRSEPKGLDSNFKIQPGNTLALTKSLDREFSENCILFIQAEKSTRRKKRDLSISGASSILALNITVLDVNDNPPSFYEDGNLVSSMVYHVSDSKSLGDVLFSVEVSDKDAHQRISFNLNDSHNFYLVENPTKYSHSSHLDIHCKTARGVGRKEVYIINITALDADLLSSNYLATIVFIPDANTLVYSIPISAQDFAAEEKTLMRNLSEILNLDIRLSNYLPHKDKKDVAIDRTDIYVYGYKSGNDSNSLLQKEELFRMFNQSHKKIEELFNCNSQSSGCFEVIPWIPHDQNLCVETEVGLITIAIVIFIAGIVGIVLVIHHMKSLEYSDEKYGIDSLELESMSSNSLHPAAAINPMFTETAFNKNDSIRSKKENVLLGKQPKNSRQYESQEMTMYFADDCLNPILNGADSGVEDSSSSTQGHSDMEASANFEEGDQQRVVANASEEEDSEVVITSFGSEVITRVESSSVDLCFDAGDSSDDNLDDVDSPSAAVVEANDNDLVSDKQEDITTQKSLGINFETGPETDVAKRSSMDDLVISKKEETVASTSENRNETGGQLQENLPKEDSEDDSDTFSTQF